MAKPKPTARKPRKRKPKSRFSLDRGLVSVVMSILSLTLLGAALITESLLLLVVTALSALATALQVRWAQRRAADEVRKQTARPRSRPKPTTKPTPPPSDSESSPGPAPAGGAVLCTDTAKRIEECGCASRHVASAEGARRYGLPIGSPMGRRAKKERPAATVQSG